MIETLITLYKYENGHIKLIFDCRYSSPNALRSVLYCERMDRGEKGDSSFSNKLIFTFWVGGSVKFREEKWTLEEMGP